MYKYIPFIISIITSILFAGCITSKNTSQDKVTVDVFSEEYYNNASNNLERLQRLISGVFVFYHDDVDKKVVKWEVNEAIPVNDKQKALSKQYLEGAFLIQ